MRPSRELACISRVEKASAREAVSHSVVLAVNLADGPFAACLRQLLAQVVAFSEEDPQVVPVAAPSARHHHNNKQRIQFKSQVTG